MINNLTQYIDNMINSPFKGFVVGTSTFIVSLTSWIQLGGSILGIIGTGCGAFMGIVSVKSWWKKYSAEKIKEKNLKRRKSDKI